jgi:hypothetical protein
MTWLRELFRPRPWHLFRPGSWKESLIFGATVTIALLVVHYVF